MEFIDNIMLKSTGTGKVRVFVMGDRNYFAVVMQYGDYVKACFFGAIVTTYIITRCVDDVVLFSAVDCAFG